MSLYRDLLGARFDTLPAAVQAFHAPVGREVWRGEAEVTRGRGLFASLVCTAFGFPRAGTRVPLTMTVTERDGAEDWDRDFDGRVMSSAQIAQDQLLSERLGPITVFMQVEIDEIGLSVQPMRWSLLGVPLPQFLMPRTTNHETEQDGRFHFDVEISAPLIGHLVSYRGFLERDG